jgi:hypothetical protein
MVREYASDQLGFDETHQLQDRSATWFVELAERIDRGLQSSDERMWLQRLTVEVDNIRATASWLMSVQDHERIARLSSAVMWAGFCVSATGLVDVVALAMRSSVKRGGRVEPVAACLAAAAAATRGKSDEARSIIDAVHDDDLTAWGWWTKAMLQLNAGDARVATQSYLRAVATPVAHEGQLIFFLSIAAMMSSLYGSMDHAWELSADAMARAERTGSPTARANALYGRAQVVSLGGGDPATGVALLSAAADDAITTQAASNVLANLGQYKMLLGHDRDALSDLYKCVELAERHGEVTALPWTLEFLVIVLSRLGAMDLAARVDGHLHGMRHTVLDHNRQRYLMAMERVVVEISETRFAEEREAGERTPTTEFLRLLVESITHLDVTHT